MAERKHEAVVRLNSKNINQYAYRFAMCLRYADGPMPKQEAAEKLGLTLGQMSALVKYMRRCSLEDLELFIRWYPISSKHGYTFPKTWEDFLPCFATLYLWATSILKTITPMKAKMDLEGIDYNKWIEQKQIEEGEIELNYLSEMSIDKNASWFFEED